MNEKELRELDAWIAEHVMGWIPCWGDYWNGAFNEGKFNCAIKDADCWAYEYEGGNICGDGAKEYCSTSANEWNPTIDPAGAMQVLEKCHEQCCVETGIFENVSGSKRGYFARSVYKDITVEAETLEIAIALFSKKLFTAA